MIQRSAYLKQVAALQDQVWVGAEGTVFFFLAASGYAWKVAGIALHAADKLEVKVRGPVAVFGKGANFSYFFAPGKWLAGVQAVKGTAAQVAVEGIKSRAIQLVLQDNGGAIVAKVCVILKAVHYSGKWSVNSCPDLQPDVYAEVQVAAFGCYIKMVAAAIDKPVFEVAANANGYPLL